MICCTDWGVLVDVVGFCFLNLGLKYQPQKEFVQWIQAGPKPIYIGFGSMVWLLLSYTHNSLNNYMNGLVDCSLLHLQVDIK